jgi:hypothetical protein
MVNTMSMKNKEVRHGEGHATEMSPLQSSVGASGREGVRLPKVPLTKVARAVNYERIGRRVWGRIRGVALAHVKQAIRDGRLKPIAGQVCVDCGRPAYAYEHRNYNRPLAVEPVCQPCNYRRGRARLDLTQWLYEHVPFPRTTRS